MNTNKSNTLLHTIAIFVGILVFLLGGAGITKVAADAAIPGDALYPVKTTFEQARLSLAQDAGERAQIKIAFAAKHLEEIEALVAEGRYREIRQTVVQFESDINGALLELETVSKADPTRASAIAAEVASELTRYAKILSDLSVTAPEAVRGEFHRALDTTQLVGGLNQANSNDDSNMNGNANMNDDDANSNGGDDSLNGNSNANTNDDDANSNGNDDSVNENANDDHGQDGNTNDANSNDDDSVNANSNDDSSMGANTNDDDANSNSDDRINANTNTNEDHSGDSVGANTNDGGSQEDDGGQEDRGGGDNSGSDNGGSQDDHGGDNGGSQDDHGGDDKSDN